MRVQDLAYEGGEVFAKGPLNTIKATASEAVEELLGGLDELLEGTEKLVQR